MRDSDLKYDRLDKKCVGRLGQDTRVKFKMNETRQEAQKPSREMIQEESIKRMKERERERDNDFQVLSLSEFLYY